MKIRKKNKIKIKSIFYDSDNLLKLRSIYLYNAPPKPIQKFILI